MDNRALFWRWCSNISTLVKIEAAYASERGQPPFDPAMMTGLLLYGFCNGVHSSRRIAKAAHQRIDFMSIMSIVGLDPPDFRAVSDFRKRHLKALAGLLGKAVRTGGVGEARPSRARRHEDQGERLQAQGDELRAHGQAGGGA